jgi:hypothetical protein
MATVKYIGPSGQVNYEVGIESGDPNLVPEHVYDLADDLAERLVKSSKYWVKVKIKKLSDEKVDD